MTTKCLEKTPHGTENSITDHQGKYPSLGANPLMKETSMADLYGWKLK